MQYLIYILGTIGALVFWTGLIVLIEKLQDAIGYQLHNRGSALWRARRAVAAWLRKGLQEPF